MTVAVFLGVAHYCVMSLCLAGRVRGAESETNSLERLGETPFPAVEIPPQLSRRAATRALAGGLPFESRGVWGMGPECSAEEVLGAIKDAGSPSAPGSIQSTWESLDTHYRTPQWLSNGKFGIFIHFGLYSIPGVNEWYQKYMYSHDAIRAGHIARYGPLDSFGYKDFMPLFTLPEYRPTEWAALFRASGARWVMPTAEHHDGYSLWDSRVNPFNSVRTGPKRDVIGELARALRAEGLYFGVTNHTIEHYNFIESQNIPPDLPTDLAIPEFRDFYWTDHSPGRLRRHLANWITRNIELIDQYEPDLLWFDNGVNHRMFDPLKLQVAAYYYNKARQRRQLVTITGKGTSFVAGSLQDFEDMQRAPRRPTDFPWMVHDRLIETWGYSESAKIFPVGSVVRKLIEVVARNGVYVLNVAPRGDGSIPLDQQDALRDLGEWLAINGEGIYGTTSWSVASEGGDLPQNDSDYAPGDIRFTAKNGDLYAFLMAWPEERRIEIRSIAKESDDLSIERVTMLGYEGALGFTHSARGLVVELPKSPPCNHATCLKIERSP
ncbi:MAG: alpha-L-fucosidase [Pirellulales bacterium]|nr:alpha-L-fucosidase [Pirellulales bacterium]